MPQKSSSHSTSESQAVSDSFLGINRCNRRLLCKPSSTSNSKSNEVNKIVNIGNALGFNMDGKEVDVQRILVKKAEGKSGGIVAIWEAFVFNPIYTTSGDGLLTILGNWRGVDVLCLMVHLSLENTTFLELPFTSQEIKDVVWDCGEDKALGPDGFTFKLIKKHWNILGNDGLVLNGEYGFFLVSIQVMHRFSSTAEVEIDKVPISHLPFVDDAHGEWSTFNVRNLSRTLTCFHLSSGLKVNFNKRHVEQVEGDVVKLHDESWGLETSFDVLFESLWCRGLYGAKGRDVELFKAMILDKIMNDKDCSLVFGVFKLMKWVSEDHSYVTGGEPEYPQELFSAVDLLISPNSFLSSILVVVIIVTVVIVVVILIVVVVAIVGVVIVVAIFRGNPPMKASINFSEFGTMFRHKTANS
ncbi:hypothetical protein Tco_0381152 [Tanacetum coccineum]